MFTASREALKALYEENCKTPVRLTKLTYTSIFPKALTNTELAIGLPGLQ